MKNNRTKLYKYAEILINAKLDSKAKALLLFYAYVYNWEEAKASYWSQRRICASVGLSSSTYQAKRKYLEDLGWIKVVHRGFETPCKVSVLIGMDDPDYESKSWAKWHPSNVSVLPEEKEEDSEIDELNIEQQMLDLSRLESNSIEKAIRNTPPDTERFEKLMEWFG